MHLPDRDRLPQVSPDSVSDFVVVLNGTVSISVIPLEDLPIGILHYPLWLAPLYLCAVAKPGRTCWILVIYPTSSKKVPVGNLGHFIGRVVSAIPNISPLQQER